MKRCLCSSMRCKSPACMFVACGLHVKTSGQKVTLYLRMDRKDKYCFLKPSYCILHTIYCILYIAYYMYYILHILHTKRIISMPSVHTAVHRRVTHSAFCINWQLLLLFFFLQTLSTNARLDSGCDVAEYCIVGNSRQGKLVGCIQYTSRNFLACCRFCM